jgi:uncharacterized protein YbjT (DUF2867 family)/uncharacterized membrane protein YphA (DoxX/SURF4 family)
LSVNVLLAGASGFIGQRLAAALSAAGHTVIGGGRRRSGPTAHVLRWIDLDYSAPRPHEWTRALLGIDVVINAVGILREDRGQSFESIHFEGPRTLFSAAQSAGVRRVIQISALGADEHASSGYHRSKHEADAFLMHLPLEWIVVQPSLVYGAGGTSAALFETLASLPFIPVPGNGAQPVQPVHIDDLVAAVVRLVDSPQANQVLSAVGPEPLPLRVFLVSLREALGLEPTRVLNIPMPLVSLAARAGNLLSGALLDSETLAMLERGNTASAQPLEQLLGRRPRTVLKFIAPGEKPMQGAIAQFRWLEWLLRAGIASMWLIAGIVSLGLYPIEASLQLLRQIGAPASLAPVLLTGAALLDIILGVLTLWPRAPRWFWSAQIALVAVYTLIITLRLPQLWLEPFGPVAKNLPILALLLMMRQLAVRR